MARIQIMHLPAPADEYPFILDEVEPDLQQVLSERETFGLREATGARGVLVFPGTVEVL